MIYPILILTLFLIVQILFTFQSRKNILDREKNQLLDTVNKANEVYDLEKLTALLKEQQARIDTLENKQANMYPVGSIYISTKNENPKDIYGGTWVSFGTGRTLVGIDPNQTEFNIVEKLGGEKTHTLTIDEMPSHNHLTIDSGYSVEVFNTNALTKGSTYAMWYGANKSYTGKSGGDKAHNNLQPYITVYMWKRTA